MGDGGLLTELPEFLEISEFEVRCLIFDVRGTRPAHPLANHAFARPRRRARRVSRDNQIAALQQTHRLDVQPVGFDLGIRNQPRFIGVGQDAVRHLTS